MKNTITVTSIILVLYIKMYFFQCFVSLIHVSNRTFQKSKPMISRDLYLSFPLNHFFLLRGFWKYLKAFQHNSTEVIVIIIAFTTVSRPTLLFKYASMLVAVFRLLISIVCCLTSFILKACLHVLQNFLIYLLVLLRFRLAGRVLFHILFD
jgi:ABC-type polysaccharide/polyol phosphate export permease